jgi:hypothetical protein
MTKPYAVFDTEIIGDKKPVFHIRVRQLKPRRTHSFWLHRKGDLDKFEALLPKFTFVGFNSESFDRPLIAAALMGHEAKTLKEFANLIIRADMRSWQTYREFKIDFVEYDHIDLTEVAPGVMISLKIYEGRMGMKTIMDMPIPHDQDVKPSQYPIIEQYCNNDLDGTEALLNALSTEIEMRTLMSAKYDVDLRSKSDAQIAEAIFKKRLGLKSTDKIIPPYITYEAPALIKTTNEDVLRLIWELENHMFTLNRGNGSPEVPDFLEAPRSFGKGTYQVGVGGLHSTHDKRLYLEANEDRLLSDIDALSYYPNVMMKAGLMPRLKNNKGPMFLEEYRSMYDKRIEAKRAGNKKVANSLKITINGTFGKLGNLYCSFYSPESMLGVTLTGELNLLCLIVELDKIKGVKVESANTDGVLVSYPPSAREKVLAVFAKNSKRTGFEYEETQYSKIAMKDVNNYIAITTDGKVKRKGLYASNNPDENPLYLMKNPTMEVCTELAIDYLKEGVIDISRYTDMRDFVAIRNVKGGGIQHQRTMLVDDWELIGTDYQGKNRWFAKGWRDEGFEPASVDAGPGSGWDKNWKAPIVRKSRPPPREVGLGGVPFGRVARWYMTTERLPAITYVSSGNNVPKTEGAKLCMVLPAKLPRDLNKQWYIDEAISILDSCGVCQIDLQSVKTRSTK